MRMTDPLHRLRTAHHETAHAVVALHYGLDVDYCRIERSGRVYEGVTGVTIDPPEECPQVADALGAVFAAGALAEIRFLTDAGIRLAHWWAQRGCGHDEDAWEKVSPHATITLDRARQNAAAVLDTSWARIEAAARVLAQDLHIDVARI